MPTSRARHAINSQRSKQLRLVTLGGLELSAAAGDDEAPRAQRGKLAVLVVLALARRPMSRDALIEMFWGDEDEERARHSLSNALSFLRGVLGRDSIATRQSEVELSSDARLAIDALEFATACEIGDYERALELYRGEFLDGVFIGSASFDRWASRERARLAAQFSQASAARCQLLAKAERFDEAVATAMRWNEEDFGNPQAMLVVARHAMRASAPVAASALVALRRTMENSKSLDARVVAAAAELDERVLSNTPVSRATKQPENSAPEAARLPVAELPSTSTPRAPTRGRIMRWSVLAALAALTIFALWIIPARNRKTLAIARPVVLVAGIEGARGDTAIAWLGDGMQQMIAAELARSSVVDIVDLSRLRDLLARGGYTARHITADESRTLARQLGASLVVTGGVTQGPSGSVVIDVSVHDVETGMLRHLFTVAGTDAVAVADQVAARIVSAAAGDAPGPHLADVETGNLSAYQHFIRAEEARAQFHALDQRIELDAALAADSGFVSAIVQRLGLARADEDRAAEARLAKLFATAVAKGRVTEWDRLTQAEYVAMHEGDHARAEALARQLVDRYPNDPRAYRVLADLAWTHGKWALSDSVSRRALSLDSLATVAGDGPCAPCAALGEMAMTRTTRGDLIGAEQAARRYVALQPNLAVAWSMLADVLAYGGHYDAALAAGRHAMTVAGSDAPIFETRLARLLLIARRYDAVDSMIARWRTDSRVDDPEGMRDIVSTLQRERGQFRASVETLRSGNSLVLANSLARSDRLDSAAILFHASAHPAAVEPESPLRSLRGDRARAFAWQHALLADAIAPRADVATLRALADSIDAIGAQSYYARDWRLAHHVRGLIAEREDRWDDAVREFQSARWGVAGWTRTNVEIARAELARGRPAAAIAVLRDAYVGPLDAMGRYVPRSELDYWMAIAFEKAGRLDSAAVYRAYVRNAWSHADPEVMRTMMSMQ